MPVLFSVVENANKSHHTKNRYFHKQSDTKQYTHHSLTMSQEETATVAPVQSGGVGKAKAADKWAHLQRGKHDRRLDHSFLAAFNPPAFMFTLAVPYKHKKTQLQGSTLINVAMPAKNAFGENSNSDNEDEDEDDEDGNPKAFNSMYDDGFEELMAPLNSVLKGVDPAISVDDAVELHQYNGNNSTCNDAHIVYNPEMDEYLINTQLCDSMHLPLKKAE